MFIALKGISYSFFSFHNNLNQFYCALVDGIIFNYINRQLVLTSLLFLMSASLALAPFSPNLGLLFADAGLCGFGGGGEH